MKSLFYCLFLSYFLTSLATIPYGSIPECAFNEDCDDDKWCENWTCVNPCAAGCVDNNTVCSVSNHILSCLCSPGYSRDPILGCIPSPEECALDEDCDDDKWCENWTCVNPCAAGCVDNNTVCSVSNHLASCSCSPGYSGHPMLGCNPSPSPIPCLPALPREKQFYVEFTKEVSWHGALMACLRNHSQLASVESYEELQAINHIIEKTGRKSSGFWVSGADHGEVNQFIWVSTGKPINRSAEFWLLGEANDIKYRYYVEFGKELDENCVILNPSDRGHRLNNLKCENQFYFICQY